MNDRLTALGVSYPKASEIDLFEEKIMIFGSPGSGKSTLMGDPHVLRLDFDRKGGTMGGQGPVWPPPDKEITWAQILSTLPKILASLDDVWIVAMDTFIKALGLVQDHVAKECGSQPFSALDARRAWPMVYNEFAKFQSLIENAGKLPCWLVHLVDQKRTSIVDGKEVQITVESVGLSEGIWKKVSIEPTVRIWLTTESVETKEPVVGKDGNVVMRNGHFVMRGTGVYQKQTSAVFRCHPNRHPEMCRLLNANEVFPAEVNSIPLEKGFTHLRDAVLKHSAMHLNTSPLD